jgi:hypothetical protein
VFGEPKVNAKSKPTGRSGRSTGLARKEHRADDAPRVCPEPLILGESHVVSGIPTQSVGDRADERLAWWIIGGVALSLMAIFVASFLLDAIVRSRLERTINASLNGYHANLSSAHLQLLDGALTLSGLTVTQDAYPRTPVVLLPVLSAQIQWRELLSMRVVADLRLSRPEVQINLAQFRAQRANQVSVNEQASALEKIYPFKINRFQVVDGTVSYLDEDDGRPLSLEHVNLTADNLRNIDSPTAAYPSPFHATASIFGPGEIAVDGHGSFTELPSARFLATYRIARLPLAQLEPELKRANLEVTGGTLDANGIFEYSPTVAKAEVYEAAVDAVDINYSHTTETADAERLDELKHGVEAADRSGLVLKVDRLNITNSRIAYTNVVRDKPYKLFVAALGGAVTDLSNQSSDEISSLNLHGRPMDQGDLRVVGTFRPQRPGPDFSLDMAVRDVGLVALNDLLLAYGGFDVQSGTLSIYSQATVNGEWIRGYVRPLFSDLELYNPGKNSDQPGLRKAFELTTGEPPKLATGRSSATVATKVDISEKLDHPDMNLWQAIEELAANAFVKAIRPGFDRQAKPVQD